MEGCGAKTSIRDLHIARQVDLMLAKASLYMKAGVSKGSGARGAKGAKRGLGG
jgi:hypothetical protein